jgi:hypothetical protein
MKRLLATCVLFLLASVQQASAVTIHSEDFNSNGGGYSVDNEGSPEGPWLYDLTSGTWFANGSENLGAPSHSRLISPPITVARSSSVDISFTHRYSIEGDLWDGAAVFVSVNGGAFTQVPSSAFTANGYTGFGLIGNHELLGGEGYNGDSPGYGAGMFITSTANLGTFSGDDSIRVLFLGAWDEFAKGQTPNWQIDSVQITQAIPEPTSISILAMVGIGLAYPVRRRIARRG